MALRDCIETVKAASGNKLSDAEALDILQNVERLKKKTRAEGDIVQAEEKLAELAAAEAEEVKINAALARKHAAINARVRDKLDFARERLKTAGFSPSEALRVIMRGGNRRVQGVRASVAATQTAFEARYLGSVLGKIVEEMPHIERLLSGRRLGLDRTETIAFGERTAREMFEIREGGKPGVTGDADAKWMAKVLSDTLEVSRRDINRLGGNIGKLDGYVPQSHDAWRLLKTSEAEWTGQIMPRLDLERTFPDLDADEAKAVLGEIYRTITTGADPQAIGIRERGERTGPANLAKRLSRDRVLHFKSADDWIAYNQQFGFADPIGAVFKQLRTAARLGGQMQVLGPNPTVMLEGLAAAEMRRLRDVPGRESRAEVNRLQNILDWGDTKVMTGEAFSILGPRLAKTGNFIRQWEAMSKLGAVVISSITDAVTLASNLRFQGRTMTEAYGRVFNQYFHGRGKGEQRRISFLLGEGFDGIIDNIVTPYAAMDSAIGKTSRAMSFFFRLSGLTWWTDTGRAVGARIMAADMGSLAGRSFDKLDARYRNVLELQGFDAARWDVVRQAAWKGENGNTYVTPDALRSLPDNAFDRLIAGDIALAREASKPGPALDKRIAQIRERARADLEVDLHRFFADEVGFGIIESDARTRAVTSGGTRPGTVAGEVVRMVMQFKAFPVAFTQRVLGRSINSGPAYASGGEAILRNSLHMGEMLGVLWVSGLLAQWGKDIAKGKTPKELWGDDGINLKTIGAAFMQSGGLGIYGDFLFAEKNRFGGSWAENLSGPALGDIITAGDLLLRTRDLIAGKENADRVFKDLFRLVESDTPFANLFFAKAGLDYLFLNSIKESLSPGYLRRQERRNRKDYGQDFFLPRTVG